MVSAQQLMMVEDLFQPEVVQGRIGIVFSGGPVCALATPMQRSLQDVGGMLVIQFIPLCCTIPIPRELADVKALFAFVEVGGNMGFVTLNDTLSAKISDFAKRVEAAELEGCYCNFPLSPEFQGFFKTYRSGI